MERICTIFVLSLLLSLCASQTCNCNGCTCDNGPCPFIVPAQTYASSGNNCTGSTCIVSVKAASTDGSTFYLYTMDQSSYNNFLATGGKGSFTYYTALSAPNSNTNCINAPFSSVLSGPFWVVVGCTNALSSCPIQYQILFQSDAMLLSPNGMGILSFFILLVISLTKL